MKGEVMGKKIGRRDFLKNSAQLGLTAAVGGTVLSRLGGGMHAGASIANDIDIAVVNGADYHKSTLKAVDMLGGISRFVPKGAKVALLPNAQRWHPGTFTKPEIVKAVIQMCRQAGAEEVNVLSYLDRKNWDLTGLAEAIEAEGANLKLIEREEDNFKAVPIPKGKALTEAMLLKEFFNNDVFIDMPITKDHAGNKFTGTMKNLMGLNFPKNNRLFHKTDWKTDAGAIQHLDQCIADLNTIAKPTLCVVDATEFIITNGPMGPGKIIQPQKVVAGLDRVAIDAFCTTLWGLKAEDIFMIKSAYEHGLGEIDLKKVQIKEVKA